MSDKISIQMFNSFVVLYKDNKLTVNEIKSNKLLKIFVCLLSNSYPVSSDNLIDLIWSEDEINNPLNALKNLVYRLRKIIKEYLNINDLIVTGKRFYSINNNYDISIDVVAYEQINEMLSNDKNEILYQQLISLYKGKYLNELNDMHLIISKSSFYHSIFIKRLKEYVAILENNHDYKTMELVAYKALMIDELAEECYVILIKALYHQKLYNQAIHTCKVATKTLFDNLGVNPSKELKYFNNLLINKYKTVSFDDVLLGLNTVEDRQECDYKTFKLVYNICNKLSMQNEVIIITIDSNKKANIYFEKILNYVLRDTDIYIKYNLKQYLILAINYTNKELNDLLAIIKSKNRHQMLMDIKIKTYQPV